MSESRNEPVVTEPTPEQAEKNARDKEEQAKRNKEAEDRAWEDKVAAWVYRHGGPFKWRSATEADNGYIEERRKAMGDVSETSYLGAMGGGSIEKLPTGIYWEDKGQDSKERVYINWNAETGKAFPTPMPNPEKDPEGFRLAYRQTIKFLASQGVDPIMIEYDSHEYVSKKGVSIIVEEMEALGVSFVYGPNVQKVLYETLTPAGRVPHDNPKSTNRDTFWTDKQRESNIRRSENDPFYNISKDRTFQNLAKNLEEQEKNMKKDEIRDAINHFVELKQKDNPRLGRNDALKEVLNEQFWQTVQSDPTAPRFPYDNNKTPQANLEQLLTNDAWVKGKAYDLQGLKNLTEENDARAEAEGRRPELSEEQAKERLEELAKELDGLEGQQKNIDSSVQQLESYTEGSEGIFNRSVQDDLIAPNQEKTFEGLNDLRQTCEKSGDTLFKATEKHADELEKRAERCESQARRLQGEDRSPEMNKQAKELQDKAAALREKAAEALDKAAKLEVKNNKVADKIQNVVAPIPSAPRPGT